MRYGLPYKGSKNQIAKWLIDQLPPAETFVDLFFGGGAVTHAALLSGKYKRFIVNDIDARLPKLFLECAYGKHTVESHPEWISREEFHRRKETDAYVALVWSFGNNGLDYIYGADVEEYKHAYHLAVFNDDLRPFEDLGINLTRSTEKAVYARYTDYKRQLQRMYGANGKVRNEQLERLQIAENIQRLQSLQSLQSYGTTYENVPIPPNSLIYCDIPYIGTNCGKYYPKEIFKHDLFYEWALQQDNIFISEYTMPSNFIEIANTEKVVLSAANGNSNTATERLYTNRRTYDRMSQRQKDVIASNLATQISLFDYAFNPYQD